MSHLTVKPIGLPRERVAFDGDFASGGNGQCFGDSSADHGYLGQDFLFRVPVIVGVTGRWTTLNLILSKKVGNAVQEKDN